jgi:hypothetical protein
MIGKWIDYAIGIFFLAILVPIGIVTFFAMASPGSPAPDLPSQGCGIITNTSDSITQTHTSMIFTGKIWMPAHTTTTRYHRFMVCMNGTKEDRGYS